MLKKFFLVSSLLVTSLSAQATVISHFGYERDSAKNIVTGGGLEWLKWDETKNMSINSALTAHAEHGWRLASNIEMANLFNAFQFGTYTFTDNETENQYSPAPWTSREDSNHNAFINLFGHTKRSACDSPIARGCYLGNDPFSFSGALFGSDSNGNKRFHRGWVLDDTTRVDGRMSRQWHRVDIVADTMSEHESAYDYGVALVRVSGWTPPVSVPTPGSIGLLALGLFALGYRRRQVLGR